ncbi:hypothetical protein G3I67_07815 [Orrella sp. NBD-18]|uniref:Anti sigma-E protein RseA N-terminal domain-containing protein n=1 Tax=Sheuella amnicola TaxID=2707330 RepID=A0A6B2R724_9BURK|nr:RseA family anti-sigma factor [Sheuella amnicola]NDY83135.1 hypothetical protein [Sheuella amnicola]HBI83416.1 hypothetical protein [Alcaligenaceae bacterium]
MQQSKQHVASPELNRDEVSITISAWMDGDEVDLASEVLSTEHGLEQWKLYHLIGDTLRTPELAVTRGETLAARVHAAVAAEPAIIAAPKPVSKIEDRPQRKAHWIRRYGLPGLAMAAAVASVIWVARPLIVPEMGNVPSQMANAPSANVMASNADMPAVRDYVSAHRSMSGPSAVRQVSFGASR